MIQIQATDQGTVDRAARLLAGINGGLDKALRSAASRSTQHLRTQSGKAVRERYAISAGNLRSEQNVKVRYQYGNGVLATVTFSGSKIPLWRYQGSSGSPSYDTSRLENILTGSGWRKAHPGKPAKGHQLKSTSPQTLHDAFYARMGSGHIGIFERTGGETSSGRGEIREVMGSSVPQMLGSDEVTKKLSESTMAKFEERLDHEVLAILNGWH